MFIGYNTYRKQFKDPANSVGSSIVNAAIIVILGNIYQVLAKILANWENHRFNEGWESSLSTKNFSFQFVNAYIALFSIAFYERNFNLLAQTLAIILVIKQIFKTTLNVFIKWARVRIRQRNLNKIFEDRDKDIQYQVESQLILDKNSGVILLKYSEIMIQLGYIVMFA